MKKISLFAILLACLTASAQESEENLVIEKGTWNIRGNASIRFSNNDNRLNLQDFVAENSLNSFTIAPSFGYTLKNNLVVGVGLQYLNQKTEGSTTSLNNTDNFKSTNNSIGLVPYIRGYKALGKQLALYLQGEAGYNRNWGKSEQNGQSENNDFTGNNLFIGIRPGITYFLDKKLAMEANYGALGYSFNETKYEDGRSTKSDSFNLNLDASNIFFGLAYYF
ncbi:outer membrane beta-barrel protein [Maribacter sp. 4G9]|uniref:outer membrane beta-barrel protein n=1 Tax=Maribacter sp. 4G9 TaxID=1889777 RepID=UPI000C157264|nr:outer membrane beta-barrel protein [Maribacter sp. 4G9]PIB37978.1 hypothetical protein BFP75_18710 [Maribacter sp. 4G9]